VTSVFGTKKKISNPWPKNAAFKDASCEVREPKVMVALLDDEYLGPHLAKLNTKGGLKYRRYFDLGVSKNSGFFARIIGFLIGFSIIFTIHFGGQRLFLETPTVLQYGRDACRYETTNHKTTSFSLTADQCMDFSQCGIVDTSICTHS